jgi:hypothetical protein
MLGSVFFDTGYLLRRRLRPVAVGTQEKGISIIFLMRRESFLRKEETFWIQQCITHRIHPDMWEQKHLK